MSNRWFRFVIALLAIGAASGAGYRIFQQEQQRAGDVASSRLAEQSAESVVATLAELKAALHAYVAAGQGQGFWTARAATLLDTLRTRVSELDSIASGVGVPLTEALDQSDRLAASEQRAREHVRSGQALLAGEVIFTDARELLDAIHIQLARAHDQIVQSADIRHAEIRREQTMLALGAAGALVFAVLLLVIPGRTPLPVERESVAAAAPRPAGQYIEPETSSTGSTLFTSSAPPALLREAAAVCTDLGRVSQSLEISTLLGRAATVLSASGIVVWMSSDNRDELFPVASAGYDDRIFARIGSIHRSSSNLTAAAFRSGGARTTVGVGPSAAALAVPLLTPQGPVGVFSAELRNISEVDGDRLAIATIFAAQLSTLLGSMSGSDAEAAVPAQQAQG